MTSKPESQTGKSGLACARSSSWKTVILGAGLCGLSAAYHLKEQGDEDYVVLERGPRAGGLCLTERYDGFSFDHSIHILYSQDAYAQDLIFRRLLGDNIHRQVRQSYCYTHSVYTEYPYQANQRSLPCRVVTGTFSG